MTSPTSKIFWPVHVCSPRTRTGFLVGWNLRSFTACVAAVVHGVELNELERVLAAVSADLRTPFGRTSRDCLVPPIVLGVLLVPGKNVGEEDSGQTMLESQGVAEKLENANLWMTVEMLDNFMPSLRSIHCCGFPYTHISSTIIYYKQPNPVHLQYLSLEPLVLDILAHEGTRTRTGERSQQQEAIVKNVEKIVGVWGDRRTGGGSVEAWNEMEVVLHQINSSYYLEKHLLAHRLRTLRLRKHAHRPMLENAADILRHALVAIFTFALWPVPIFWPTVRPFLLRPVITVLFFIRATVEGVLGLLNAKLPAWVAGGIKLKDLSTAAQQIDLRLQQVCFWPWQYMMLRQQNWGNGAFTRAQYISFYNSMWLVANDIIIGVALGSFLANNSVLIARGIHSNLDYYMVDSLRDMIDWLMGWPAGLKLNSELDKFMGDLFLWLVELWRNCLIYIRPATPTIIGMIGLSGVFGASMIFALLSDLLAFMTLHVFWFYMVAARIFNWQLTILYSLFNLFQGKKRNMLRSRIDSCDYDLDQLLLGTVLFTLLTFLFPTIVVYYLTFALMRVAVIFLQAALETFLACLNHFPLFAIMLRFKDPERLPGGLRFEIPEQDYFVARHRPLFWLAKLVYRILTTSTFSTHYGAMPAKPHTEQFSESRLHATTDKNTSRIGLSRRRKINNRDDRPSSTFSENGVRPNVPNVSYSFMMNLPIPFSAIFFQYLLLWKRLSAHYLSLYVLRCLISGETIRPILRLQYPMLPETRPTLANFWQLFGVGDADGTVR